MPSYTKQTPKAVRDWLDTQLIPFPRDCLTLDKVADDCHRRYKANRWKGGELEAARAVVAWGASCLAFNRDFTADHWDWIAAKDMYGHETGFSRFVEILRPAIAASPAWRQTDAQIVEELQEIDAAAALLLRITEHSMRFDIGLRNVAGCFPEVQPLLDHSGELQRAEREKGFAAAQAARSSGQDINAIIAASLSLDGYREPSLSHFLLALRSALRGKLPVALPKNAYELPDHLKDGDESDNVSTASMLALSPELKKALGMQLEEFDPVAALRRNGGEFGAYPNRKDALRRAVVLAFPEALYTHRYTEPPKTPVASVIEAACLAWFGTSQTQKEINAAIKPDRDRLEPAMILDVKNYLRAEKLRQERLAAGLSEAEIRRLTFQDFLSDDLPGVKGAVLAGLEKMAVEPDPEPNPSPVAKQRIKPAGKPHK